MADNKFQYISSGQTTLSGHNLEFLENNHHEASRHEARVGVLGNDSRNISLSMSSFSGGSSSNLSLSDSFHDIQQFSVDSFKNEQSYSLFDYNPRLSGLNVDLTKRLEQCKKIEALDGSLMMDKTRTKLEQTNDDSMSDHEETSNSTLLEQALGDLSEFLNIIQSYTSKRNMQSTPTSELNRHGFVSIPRRRISMAVLLLIISAYLQLVNVYDKIFLSLSAQLFETSDGSIASTTGQLTPPGLQLKGFTVGQGSLQTKILVHAILHQFDLLERMLGLSADLRVTGKPGVYVGLFEDERARALLGAISNGNRIENGWRQMQVEDHRSSTALASLRDTIKVVQVMLDT
jgi:hypothetical protein